MFPHGTYRAAGETEIKQFTPGMTLEQQVGRVVEKGSPEGVPEAALRGEGPAL